MGLRAGGDMYNGENHKVSSHFHGLDSVADFYDPRNLKCAIIMLLSHCRRCASNIPNFTCYSTQSHLQNEFLCLWLTSALYFSVGWQILEVVFSTRDTLGLCYCKGSNSGDISNTAPHHPGTSPEEASYGLGIHIPHKLGNWLPKHYMVYLPDDCCQEWP